MTFTTSPATTDIASSSSFDPLAPLRFPPDLRLTPEQFELVCAANREAVLELAADGLFMAMTPTGSETGARNSRLEMRLLLWADQQGGWKVCGCSSGFAPLCPDLVVELASPAGVGPRGLTALRRKMAAYQANGARLGWLLISYDQAVEVWPASGAPLATGSPSMWRLIIDAPLVPVPLPKASALAAAAKQPRREYGN